MRQRTPPRGFSLLELILVMALIVLAAAILWPSLDAAFAHYHIERAAEDLQVRIAHTRLAAMEQGVPYAFTFRPDADEFWTWACEPLETSGSLVRSSSVAGAAETGAAFDDVYDRRHYALNHKADNREFRFLSSSAADLIGAMGLGEDARAELSASVSAEQIAASRVLSQHKLALAAGSARSLAALQISGLELGTAADPIVFEPDGTSDKDAIIRVADRRNRYVEITVHAMTGAVTASSAKSITDLAGAQVVPSRANSAAASSNSGPIAPSRSREIR